MDNTDVNGTVSTRSCEHPIKATNITKNLNIVSVFPKDAVVSSTTNEVKRSARLSRKRTFKDRLAVENEDLSGNAAEKRNSIAKNMQNNKTELRKIVVPRNTAKKTNSRAHIFTKPTKNNIQNDCDPSKVSNVEHSLSTEYIDNESNISVKSSSKTHKNRGYSKSIASTKNKSMSHSENKDDISNEFKESDNFVFIRKRGRPSFKKLEFQKTDLVNTCNDNDEVDKQKTKDLTVIVEKLHNVHEPELLLKSFDDNTTMIENIRYKPSKIKKKGSDGDKLIDTAETCIPEAPSSSEASITVPIIPGEISTSALSDTNGQSLHLGILEPDVSLLSNRFNIQFEMFRKTIVGEAISVFNEKYSESVTPSMITVSPIVVDDFEVNPTENDSRNVYKQYRIEPVRESLAYEKQNLKDLMDELTKTMPSWSLNIVHNPPRYVISHLSIDMFGVPNLNKAIVLDRYFRGSIYINKVLNYKYCKYYRTANEIVKLIKELNDIST